MKKSTKLVSIFLAIVLMIQMVVPCTAEMFLNDPIKVGIHKETSKGTIIGTSVTNDTETILSDEYSVEKSNDMIASEIIGEDISLRNETSKYYRHKDGSYTAVSYSTPIHYKDNSGEWKDIDNTLVINNKFSLFGNAKYTTKSSEAKISFPQNLGNGQKISVEKNGYYFSLGICNSEEVKESGSKMSVSKAALASAKAVVANDLDRKKQITQKEDKQLSYKEKIVQDNYEKVTLKNLQSSIKYSKVFKDTDLEYIIQSDKIKENLILHKPQEEYIYSFTTDFEGLIPVEKKDGSIEFAQETEKTQVVFVLEAPYMYDNNGEISTDIKLKINKNRIDVIPDADWINESTRKFPIIIDPTIVIERNISDDATVDNIFHTYNFENTDVVYVGNATAGLRRTYIKPNLPNLPAGSIVTNSELLMYQKSYTEGSSSNNLCAFMINQNMPDWSESEITWDNQPLSTATNGSFNNGTSIIDYVSIVEEQNIQYSFNITTAVKNWYENNYNNGIMISLSNENGSGHVTLYSSENNTSNYRPSIIVNYVTNLGLEDYWTYETESIGKYGTAYVNPFNGALTYVNELLNMTGNLMPISLSVIYSTCIDTSADYIGTNKININAPFYLNIQKFLSPILTSSDFYAAGYRYKYVDGDGTIHYFVENSEDQRIIDEFDETTEIVTQGNNIVIQDKNGNKEYYNSKRLIKLEDKNGNSQEIVYNGTKIDHITDGAGRQVDISYNSNGYISCIKDPSQRNIIFEYDASNKLIKITYPGEREISFQYHSDNLLYKITAEDGTYMDLQYISTLDSEKRVSCMRHMTVANGFTETKTFAYTLTDADGQASGNTKVNYFTGGANQYSFDIYGRTISIKNEEGQSVFSTYGMDTDDRISCNSFNNVLDTSDPLSSSTNVLLNGGFEKTGTNWTNLQTAQHGSCAYSIDEAKNSTRSLKLELNDVTEAIEVDQEIEKRALDLYTFSLEVKIVEELDLSNGGGFIFGFTYKIDNTWYNECSEWIGNTNNGWENFSVSLQLPASANMSDFHVFIEIAGTTGSVYIDNAQVLLSGGSSLYNYIENSNFYKTTSAETGFNAYGWTKVYLSNDDRVVENNGKQCVKVKGSMSTDNSFLQTINFKGEEGDTIIFGGTASAFAANDKDIIRSFGFKIKLYNERTLLKTLTLDFDKSISMIEQTKAMLYTLESPCTRIVFYCQYNHQVNYAYFYDTFLYCANTGEHYTYNDAGLVESVLDNEEKTTTYKYDDYNVSQVTAELSGKEQDISTYTYDEQGNVATVSNSTDEVISYTYDEHGQVETETVASSNGKQLLTTIEYTPDGNYISKITDVNGEETLYSYYTDTPDTENSKNGLLKSVTEPSGKITEYIYDEDTDELLSVRNKGPESSDPTLTKNYTYVNGDVTQVSFGNSTYNYSYQNGKITSIQLGENSIVNYQYDQYGKLEKISTPDAGIYRPVYDVNNRVISDTWNYFTTAKYYYNPNGRLSQINDKITNKNYHFEYTTGDNIRKIVESDGKVSYFDYDTVGKLALFTFKDNNDTIYDAKYLYNERGNIEDIVIKAPEEMVMHYNYDSLKRLESYSNGPIQTSLEYNDKENSGIAGRRIVTYKNSSKGGELLNQFDYSYGGNGNVIGIASTGEIEYTATREFDAINRITKETIAGKEFSYTYNSIGKLSSVSQKTVGAEDETVQTYSYNNSVLAGAVSSIGNHTISYSSGGRIIAIDSATYTWEKNDQLKRIKDGNHEYTYSYDSQGKRVEKDVDGIKTQYVYSGDLLIQQIKNNDVIEFIYDSGSNPTGYTWNGSTYYYLKDANNYIVGVVNSNGELCEYYIYDSFGNVINSTDPNSANPLRYDGRYLDKETGMYYNDKGYYSPELRINMNLGWDNILFDTITSIVDVVEPVAPVILGSTISCIDFIVNHIPEDDKTSNSFRIGAKILAASIMVETIAFFGVVNSSLLPIIKDYSGEDFAQSDFMQTKGIFFLNKFATSILPRCEDAGTFEPKTGLRHLWFANMTLGSPWAGYLLNFERTGYKNKWWILQHTNYTTVEGKYMWQSHVGYSWVYDYFFSLGGPIEKVRMPFTQVIEGKTVYYIIWCWKADYWNLGAGAEIGIYRTDDEESKAKLFYDVDVNLNVHARMSIVYESPILGNIVLNDFHQTNWWITSFSPIIQHPDVDRIKVSLWVRIVNNGFYSGLGDAFVAEYNNDDYRDIVSKVEDGEDGKFCTSNDVGCLHVNDPDNGFQFKINY